MGIGQMGLLSLDGTKHRAACRQRHTLEAMPARDFARVARTPPSRHSLQIFASRDHRWNDPRAEDIAEDIAYPPPPISLTLRQPTCYTV